jgi:hypothetical protein
LRRGSLMLCSPERICSERSAISDFSEMVGSEGIRIPDPQIVARL